VDSLVVAEGVVFDVGEDCSHLFSLRGEMETNKVFR
jgi:hypothetical protein